MRKFISQAGIIVAAVVIGLGVDYALADWTPAPGNPPSANVAAPINVGSSDQAKAGGLALGTSTPQAAPLDVEGIGYLRGLIVGSGAGAALQYLDGNQSAGKVLTSDASGNATWQSLPTSQTGDPFNYITPVIVSSSTKPSYVYGASSNGVPVEVNVPNGGEVAIPWQTFSVAPYVPAGTTHVIVQAVLGQGGPNGVPTSVLMARAATGSPAYVITGAAAAAGSDWGGGAAQAVIPISSAGTFDWQLTYGTDIIYFALVGYIGGSPS